MPTPPRTSIDAIVSASRAILESHGLQGLTMQAVAQAVGVRAPSLYKHVADRDALVTLVADAAARDLAAHLPATEDLRGLAHGLRAWAAERPESYRLVFSGHGSLEVMAATSMPVVTLGRTLGGEAHALDAARLITAWVTGFISMELAGAFQLGGDVEAAFEYGIERLTSALSAN